MTTDDHQVSALCEAVIAVWSDVLQRDDIGADDKLGPQCTDVTQALRAVSLMNQWLGAALTLRDVLPQGTPAMVARKLYDDGTRPPSKDFHNDPTPSSTDPARGDWEVFWDSIYKFSRPEKSEFNSAGWFDRKTLSLIPESTMLEWVQGTVNRIRQMNPQKILDVGCGAGLLMHQLIDSCAVYVGADYSREAVIRLKDSLASRSKLANVEVVRVDAMAVADHVDQEFDLVIVNSVIQYFPDSNYLEKCFERIASLLSRTGAIFCGDVLNSDLHVAAHLYHALNKYNTDASAAQIMRAVNDSVKSDAVLTLSPGQLRKCIAQRGSGLSFRSLVRKGTEKSVMNLFRYDSLFSKELPVGRVPDRLVDCQDVGNLPVGEILAAELKNTRQTLVIRGARDARSFPYVRLAKALENAPPGVTLGEICEELKPLRMIDPDEVWEVGHRLGFGVAVSPDFVHPGTVNLAFYRNATDWDAAALLS